jgi:hypothetical protein
MPGRPQYSNRDTTEAKPRSAQACLKLSCLELARLQHILRKTRSNVEHAGALTLKDHMVMVSAETSQLATLSRFKAI